MKTEIFDSISINVLTPDGDATVFITYRKDLSVEHIFFFIGKAGTRLASWCNALSRMTLAALQSSSIDEVIALLDDISTDRVTMRNGVTCRSGPEALAIALSRFRQIVLDRSPPPSSSQPPDL